MEGIQRLYGNTPTALVRRNAARSVQTQKTSPRTDSFQSVLTETERAEQAAKTAPLPNFSKMTDKQKLSALATLHDATDFSGMTDVEKYKLINDRFEAAFPHVNSYMGLYGPAIICFEDPVAQANHIKSLPERISDERSRQFSTAGLSDVPKLHKEAYYSGMSKAEIAAAINQRHRGGTMADRYDALYEMFELGIGDPYAIGSAMSAMERAVEKVAVGKHPSHYYLWTGAYSDSELRAAQGYATGTRVSWAEVKKMAQAYAAEFGDKLADGLSKETQKKIDELFDGLLNTETTKERS